MKRLLPVFLLLAACSSPEVKEKEFPQAEIFEQKLGADKVYGIRITDFSEISEQRIYALQLELEEKVWTDTLYSEVSANDTVVNEVVFSQAKVKPEAKVNYRLKILDAE